MSAKKIIFNEAIFPEVISLYIESTKVTSGAYIALPRGVYTLYLAGLNEKDNKREVELFEKYANGIQFSDADYLDVIDYAFIPQRRQNDIDNDQFGICLKTDKSGKNFFEINPNKKDEVRANT